MEEPSFLKNEEPVHVKNHDEMSSNQVGKVLDSDPVNWQMNESTRDYVAKFGFKQNTSADLSLIHIYCFSSGGGG